MTSPVPRRAPDGFVGTVAGLVLLVVVGVHELDTPVTGFVAVKPVEMRTVLAEIDADAPCDEAGTPLA